MTAKKHEPLPLGRETETQNTGTSVRDGSVVSVIDRSQGLILHGQRSERDGVRANGTNGVGAAGGITVLQRNRVA